MAVISTDFRQHLTGGLHNLRRLTVTVVLAFTFVTRTNASKSTYYIRTVISYNLQMINSILYISNKIDKIKLKIRIWLSHYTQYILSWCSYKKFTKFISLPQWIEDKVKPFLAFEFDALNTHSLLTWLQIASYFNVRGWHNTEFVFILFIP